MEKKILLLLCLFVLFSCEQDEFMEFDDEVAENYVQTKATSYLSDFDPIKELVGLPLNIVHAHKKTYRYLACSKKGDRVCMTTRDDASGRQRWYLQNMGFNYKYPLLTLKKGNPMCNNGNVVVIGAKCQSSAGILPEHPVLSVFNSTDMFGNYFRYVNDGLYIQWGAVLQNSYSQLYDLQITDSKSDLKYHLSDTYPYEKGEWKIVPVGEYRIIDVQYENVASNGNYIIPKYVYCASYVFEDTPGTYTNNLSVEATFESSSQFTESFNVTAQNQSSFNWSGGDDSVPMVGINFAGSVDNSLTSAQNISYTSVEKHSITISKGITIEIAPHNPCRIEIQKKIYNADLTYVMTLEKIGGEESGKRFRIKGRWHGTVPSDLFFKCYSRENNEEVASGQILESTNTIRIKYQ